MPEPVVQTLLAEIAGHLDRLAGNGTQAAIDLRSLPLSPEARTALETALGKGEVTITIEAGGRSDIIETGYPGVWWVCHHGAGGSLLTERIEIAPVPEALAAFPADFAAGARRLTAAPGGDRCLTPTR